MCSSVGTTCSLVYYCSGTYMCDVTIIGVQGNSPIIINCHEFKGSIYTYMVFSCAHEIIAICGLHTTFEGNISFGTYMTITYFLSHDADGTINDTVTYFMMR